MNSVDIEHSERGMSMVLEPRFGRFQVPFFGFRNPRLLINDADVSDRNCKNNGSGISQVQLIAARITDRPPRGTTSFTIGTSGCLASDRSNSNNWTLRRTSPVW